MRICSPGLVSSVKRTAVAALCLAMAFAPCGVSAATKVSILGDSYSTYQGTVGCGAAHYPNNIPLEQGEQWWARVLAATGAELEANRSQNGSRMSGSDASSFLGRADQLGSPDVIFVFGGMNDDWGSVAATTLSNDVNTLFAYLDTNHPKAKKYFVLNAEMCTYNKGLKATTRAVLKAVCAEHGYPVTDLDGVLGTESTDMAATAYDHPTASGFAKVATAVLETLNAHPFVDPLPPVKSAEVTGDCVETNVDGQLVYVFTSSGTFKPDRDMLVKEALVVVGGGGGGWTIGGGGGGGGIVRIAESDCIIIPKDTVCTVTVGAGGSNFGDGKKWVNGGDGGPSSFAFDSFSWTALGGGGGAAWDTDVSPSQTGVGSGGGACGSQSKNPSRVTGKGTSGQGHDGGAADGQVPGGGGGYLTAGQNAKVRGSGSAGNGGAGLESCITGVRAVYGSGGGGGTGLGSTVYGEGGENAGDGKHANDSQRGRDATDGFGGGGGGGGYSNGLNTYNGGCPGGQGGSGTVILRLGLPSEKPEAMVTTTPSAESAAVSLKVTYVGAGATACDVSYTYRLDLPGEGYCAPVAVATGVGYNETANFTIPSLVPEHRILLKVYVTNDAEETTVVESSFTTGTLAPLDAEFAYTGTSETKVIGKETVVTFLSSGTLTVSGKPLCVGRALLVGGGGGGGWTIGAGGGGGGVLQIAEGTQLAVGEHALTIGAGGDNFQNQSSWKRGGTGGDTVVTLSGTERVAKGGGGGGTWKDDKDGAGIAISVGGAGGCGGGSTKMQESARAAGTDGQGFAGGAAADGVPGGGGGAGAPGKDGSYGSSLDSGLAGDGGDGVLSDITGENVYYGGGGGGGAGKGAESKKGYASLENAGKGGLGGGGKGGTAATATVLAEMCGTDGLGGGGGGGCYGNSCKYYGGRGGSGVIVLRLVNGTLRLDYAARSGNSLVLRFGRSVTTAESEITMYAGATYGGKDVAAWSSSSVVATFAEGAGSATATVALPADTRFVRFACDGAWSDPIVVSELPEVSVAPVVRVDASALDGSTLEIDVAVDACGVGYDACDLYVKYGLSATDLPFESQVATGVGTGSHAVQLKGLLPGRTYSYRVWARNAGGSTSALTEARGVIVPDSVEPTDVPADLPCLANDAHVTYCGGCYVEIEGGIRQGGTRAARLIVEVSQDVTFAACTTNEVAVDFQTDASYELTLSGLAESTKHYWRLKVLDATTGSLLDLLPGGDFTTALATYVWNTSVAEGAFEDPASWTVDDGRAAIAAPSATTLVIFPSGCTNTVLVSKAETCRNILFRRYSDVTFRGTAPGAALDGAHDLSDASYRRDRSLTLDNISMSVPGECFFVAGEQWNWSGFRLKLTNGARFAPGGRFGQRYASPIPAEITIENGAVFKVGTWMSYANAIVTINDAKLEGGWVLPGLDTTTSTGEKLVLTGSSALMTASVFGSNTVGDPANKLTDVVVAPTGTVVQAMIRASSASGKFGSDYEIIRFSFDPTADVFKTEGDFDIPVVEWSLGIPTNRVELLPCPAVPGTHLPIVAKESYFYFTYPAGKTADDGVDPTGISLHVAKRVKGFMLIVK